MSFRLHPAVVQTDGGPPQLVCAAYCCDDLATDEPKECQCSDVDPEVDSSGRSSDPFGTCVAGSAPSSGRRNLMMTDSDVLFAAANLTRQQGRLLQQGRTRDFTLDFVIEDDPLAQISIDTLQANSDEALSTVPGAGIDTMDSKTVCPAGKIRAGANTLCQTCP